MELLRSRKGFRRLWLGDVVSLLGDWLSLVAVSVLAMEHGDGALALAFVLAAHTLPQAIASPLAGIMVDRFDRRGLLIGANLVQAGLTMLMALAAASHEVGLVQWILVARTAVSALTIPAQTAALPRLVRDDELYRANAIMSATWSVMFAVGMTLGGALAMLGPVPALALDAMTFVIAAALLRRLPKIVPQREESNDIRLGVAIRQAFHDLHEAWCEARRSAGLLGAILAKSPLALAGGGAWILLNLSASEVSLIGTGLAVGLLQAARGVGTGVGPWWAARFLERGMSPATLMGYAQWGSFASIALFCMGGPLFLLLAWAFAWGCGIGTNWVVSTATLQRLAPDQFRGRLSAIDAMLFTAGMALSALIGAAAVDYSGVAAASGWTGLVIGVAGWFVVQQFIARPHIRGSVCATPAGD